MPSITLAEAQAVQNMETQHRSLIGMLGNLYTYLKFVNEHPSYSEHEEARGVARRALEIMEASIQDEDTSRKAD